MNGGDSERTGGVIFAGLMPHAPVLIPEVGQERVAAVEASVAAMRQLSARLVARSPDAVAVISPHAPRKGRAFGVYAGSRLRGNLETFGVPWLCLDLPNDIALAAQIRKEADTAGLRTWEIPPMPLDHGALVPLWHLVQAGWNGPTVVLSLNHPGEEGSAELGEILARAAKHVGRRLAVIASGDMSHRLTREAPGGYEPRGEEFDLNFVTHLRQGGYADLRGLDPELVEIAGQDVLGSTIAAVAAASWEATGHEVLSYQGPFGVGYGVAVLFDGQPAALSTRTNGADHVGRWWTMQLDGRIECELCPRCCRLQEGQRGFCFVRRRVNDRLILTTYGRSSGFWVDPIEKKPLNHFYPGTSVLSFGTVGCNLGCRFCQNWDISKARHSSRLSEGAAPESIAQAAEQTGCTSVAFTYNDPVIFAEYAIDVAQASHARGLQTVAVTAGYITPEARVEFFRHMDAANVDLKGFTEEFYHKFCLGRLAPVLETLKYLHDETDVWLEVTSLLIPGQNDEERQLHWAADWFAEHLGPDVPWHFTAFHPAFKMLNLPRTPLPVLEKARQIALSKGLHYVYTGNVADPAGTGTRCPQCHALLIQRDGYELSEWNLTGNRCRSCGGRIAGRFAGQPGAGTGTRFAARVV